jgi:hypothetical protein
MRDCPSGLFLLGAALTGCEAVGDTDLPSGLGLCEASLSCLVDIESDRAVTLATLMLDPETSAPAVVILLEGGDGLLTFTGPDTAPVVNNNGFLARNAVAFAAQGLAVALVNTPSDRPTGIDLTCRISADQSQDIDAVVQWVRGRTSVPVWVMGMSLGSYSATNTAIRLINPVDGRGHHSLIRARSNALLRRRATQKLNAGHSRHIHHSTRTSQEIGVIALLFSTPARAKVAQRSADIGRMGI